MTKEPLKTYRFLLKPGWLALHVGALCLAILFTNFGFWQLRRLDQRQERNALLQDRLFEEPQPLSDLLNHYNTTDLAARPDSIAYRPTILSGHYDPGHEVLLRSTQNYEGEPGYYLLTPLQLGNGSAVLINRGWVPFEFETPPVQEATPPGGEVELTGTINLERTPPSGPLASLAPRDPPGKLDITAYIDTERLEKQMPYDLLPLYVELRKQTPQQAGDLPLPLQEPDFSPGSHLGYAVQWFAFTIIGVIGYGFILRQQIEQKQGARSEKQGERR